MAASVDNTLYELKIAIDGYNTVQDDTKRKRGGVASYSRDNICFKMKICLSNNMENIFIKPDQTNISKNKL